MVKKRPNISILPLLLIVILCISWLTQLSRQDEMTYDQMVQLFEQQKVESFQFTDSSTLVMKVKGSEQPVRCRIHDYTLFYSDLNDLVKEQKAAGIITSYSYPPPHALGDAGPGGHGAGPDGQIRHCPDPWPQREG